VTNLISLGLIPRSLLRFLEESLKTDGFRFKNYIPMNASYACIEVVYYFFVTFTDGAEAIFFVYFNT